MKKLMMVLVSLLMSLIISESVFGQLTASLTQNVRINVGTVCKMVTTGEVGDLIITEGTAGVDALTPAVSTASTYSITQNVGNTLKITAQLDEPLGSGYTLTVNLASTKGVSGGVIDLSNGSVAEVVHDIQRGAENSRQITYSFSALASAGPMPTTTKNVTLTLTN